jgi:signal peptidase II
VVDFIHFNVWRGYLPDELPMIGGSYMALFPIWNVADMAIVLGVVAILFFQRQFHERMPTEGTSDAETALPADAPVEESGTETRLSEDVPVEVERRDGDPA